MFRAGKYNVKAYHVLYFFMIYSFIGWCLETTYVSLLRGGFVNRGFLIGPFCPIYGFGILLITFLLKPFRRNFILLFLGALAVTTSLEYITSVLLEALFNASLWSYSSEAFNIGGRICLKFSLLWGLASVVVVYFIHPHIYTAVSGMQPGIRTTISLLMLFYFTVDITMSITSRLDTYNGIGKLILSDTQGENSEDEAVHKDEASGGTKHYGKPAADIIKNNSDNPSWPINRFNIIDTYRASKDSIYILPFH